MASLTRPFVVRVPGDKSISHRALMFAALAEGESRVQGILESADVQSTAGVLRRLGVDVPELGPDIRVTGRGLRSLHAPREVLDCGNSGTTTRLMGGIVAGFPFEARFVGDESLSRRPMRRIAAPLRAMGASVELRDGDSLPMLVRGGALRSVSWESDRASAQVKSAVLLAGLVGGVEVSVAEPERSRDHTERMLAAQGAGIVIDELKVSLIPPAALAPLQLRVPADPSSAAFFAALAAMVPGRSVVLRYVCLNPTRTGFFDMLSAMGADVGVEHAREEGGEIVGDYVVTGAPLAGVTVGGAAVPAMIDELPLLACVASRAGGETRITGASELRVKESDRIAAVVSNLRTLGVDAEELPDGMIVRGSTQPLRGRIVTHGDHRLAMAFGVLGALPGNEIEVDDPRCAVVSFPGFWERLGEATRAFGD